MNFFAGIALSKDLAAQEGLLNDSCLLRLKEQYPNEQQKVYLSKSPCMDFVVFHEETELVDVAQNADFEVVVIGYFYEKLLSNCVNQSHVIDSASSLLQSLRNHGVDALRLLQGSFAALVHDRSNRTVYLTSDPSGQRQIFLRKLKNGYCFATKLSPIALVSPEAIEPEHEYRNFLLVYGFYPFNKTVYRDVEILQGTSVYAIKSGSLEVIPKHVVQLKPDLSKSSEHEVIEDLYELLINFTDKHARAKRVAVLLGGFDSALVASLLTRAGREVETFSFAYEDTRYNQPHTDTLSEFLGIKHNWIKIGPEVIRDGLENYAMIFDQATNWPNYLIQTNYLCKHIRKRGFQYCFTGDGCDGLFFGYPGVFKNSMLYQRIGNIQPSIVRNLLQLLDAKWLEIKLGHVYRLLLRFLRNSARKMPERGYLLFQIFDALTLKHLIGEIPDRVQKELETVTRELCKNLSDLSPATLAYLGKNQISPNKGKLNGTSDNTGLLMYSPYMHPDVRNLVSSLPEKFLRPSNQSRTNELGKYILIRMAEEKNLLPTEVILQKKVNAVAAPIDYWYQIFLKGTLLQLYAYLPFQADTEMLESLVTRKWIEEFYGGHFSSDGITSHAASLLVTYASFMKLAQIATGCLNG